MDSESALALLESKMAGLESKWPESPEDKLLAAREIGELVRELREWRGWNQHKLARQADVDMGCVVRLESGLKLPGENRLSRLVEVLGRGDSMPGET